VELLEKTDIGNPNYSNCLIAQIRTLEQVINYPNILIDKLNRLEQIEQDRAKYKLCEQDINLD